MNGRGVAMYPSGMAWSGGGIDRRAMQHDFVTSDSHVYRHSTGARARPTGQAIDGIMTCAPAVPSRSKATFRVQQWIML